MGVNINIKLLPCGKGIMQGFDPIKKVQSIELIGFSKPRCFQRLGHCVPLSFTASGGKIQATRCAGSR